MREPLVDGFTLAMVVLGLVSIAVSRWEVSRPRPPQAQTKVRWGDFLLGLAVAPLLWKWVVAFKRLPGNAPAAASGFWDSANELAVMAVCGVGLIAAVKTAASDNPRVRGQAFVATAICGAALLGLAAAWEWLLLLCALLAGGLFLVLRLDRSPLTPSTSSESLAREARSDSREPVLVALTAAALLALMLGTWTHVVEREAQRKTRSPRFSAWPRATALKDAWERTAWVAKPGDAESLRRHAEVASREQQVVCCLGLFVATVAVAAWHRNGSLPSEANRASTANRVPGAGDAG